MSAEKLFIKDENRNVINKISKYVEALSERAAVIFRFAKISKAFTIIYFYNCLYTKEKFVTNGISG